MTSQDPVLTRLVAYWETLTPSTLEDLGMFYCEDAYFCDPFNEVRGLTALTRIFGAMFERLHAPRFVFGEIIGQRDSIILLWDFHFRSKTWQPDVERKIHGTTHLRFAADGRVEYHRDYWDAAGELYEQLPVLGALLRTVKRYLA